MIILVFALAADVWVKAGVLAALPVAAVGLAFVALFPDIGIGHLWSWTGYDHKTDRVSLEPVWNDGIMVIRNKRSGQIHYRPESEQPKTIDIGMMRQVFFTEKSPDEAVHVEIIERRLPTAWRILSALLTPPWYREPQRFLIFHVAVDQVRAAVPAQAIHLGDQTVLAGDFYRRMRPTVDDGKTDPGKHGIASC